jgi:YD repeat-containing protein
MNRLLGIQPISSLASKNIHFSHDLADRITQITYPSGRELRYGRDAKGRVASVETRASPSAPWTTVLAGASYDPFGTIASASLGNGLTAANDRGLDGRLKVRRLTNNSTAMHLSHLSYVYDPDGNVTAIDDGVNPECSAIDTCQST